MLESTAPYTLIDTSALNLNSGNKTLTIYGDGNVFAAYAATPDIKAWLGEDSYNSISASEGTLVLTEVPPKLLIDEFGNSITAPRPEITNPAGSDLWLEEYAQQGSLALKMSPSTDIAVLVANDGVAPSAVKISIAWVLDNSTPAAGPLFIGGILLLLIGIWQVFKALSRNKRTTNKTKRPRPPKLQKATKQKSQYVAPKRGRRAAGSEFVAVGLAGVLLLSGCSSQYWPDFSAATVVATPSATDEPVANTSRVLSTLQVERILGRISEKINQAHSERNAEILNERVAGAELEVRSANLRVRLSNSAVPKVVDVSEKAPQVILPQRSDNWPKVLYVVQEPATAESSSVLLVLKQDSPRKNYMLHSSVELNNSTVHFPDVAISTVGATIVPNDSKLLTYSPGSVAEAYANILLVGEESEYYGWFEHEGDLYLSNFGLEYKQQRLQDRNITQFASVAFSNEVGQDALAISTLDGGALAVVNLREIEIVTPNSAYDKILPQGQVAALLGKAEAEKKVTAKYSVKLLVYIPPASVGGSMEILGSSWGIVSAVEG
ncbi:MAG: hypothetical protein KF916_01535 [Microbacteriaceae bacterium]|nr:hypothetical protein [Microbacteriaceae bacterium]